MNITSNAKQEINKHLNKNKSQIPCITWACDSNYSDSIKDGYFQFGYCELEQVKNRNAGLHIEEIEGIDFVIDIPVALRSQFNKLLIDYDIKINGVRLD